MAAAVTAAEGAACSTAAQQGARAHLTFSKNHSQIVAKPLLCPASDNDAQL